MATGQPFRPTIEIENVAVMRGSHLVLQQFSLEISAGDIIWIRGANGCGKSTLLRLVAGLLPAIAGRVDVDGTLSLCDENIGLDPNLPLEKALTFWADLDGASNAVREKALGAMGLLSLVDAPVGYLSSGQRRRAALARTIGSGAAIWLLDEPYNGLDNANAARLDAALLAHAAHGGIALVAAHQPPTINVADSIALDKPPTEGKAA